jgi:hypothetical protein
MESCCTPQILMIFNQADMKTCIGDDAQVLDAC